MGLVVLDLGLPDVDGLDVCRRLRTARPDLAILILTARDLELDIVAGLDAGADDYLVKPFRLSELLARIRAHLRRRATAPSDPAEPLAVGSLQIDRSARRCDRDPPRRRLPLRAPMKRRLVLAIAGVAAAAAVAMFALPLAAVLQRSYRDEALLTLQRDTIAATRGIDLSGGPDQIEVPHFNGNIGIYNTRGSLIAGAGPRAADHPTRRAIQGHEPTGSTPNGQLVVAVPLLNSETITGAARAQRTEANVAARAQSAWLALAGLAAGVLALAIIAALWLGRRLARPLETLAAAARRVGEGDFATRAPTTHIPEIDDVATALNSSSQRVSELVERERAFTADASHQLRTPLAALRIELERKAINPSDPPPALAKALVQVDRLQSTIETLLAVARHAPARRQTVDLNDAIRDLKTRWHAPWQQPDDRSAPPWSQHLH